MKFYMICFDHTHNESVALVTYLTSIGHDKSAPSSCEIEPGSWALVESDDRKPVDIWMALKKHQGGNTSVSLVPIDFSGLRNIRYVVGDAQVGWINRWMAPRRFDDPNVQN